MEDGGQICPTITRAGGLYRLITTVNGEDYEVRIRKLTEDECYVLMGLTMEDVRKCKNMGVSKTHLFKTAGNAICTNCVELLMEHLYKAQYNDNYECFDEKFLRENAQ